MHSRSFLLRCLSFLAFALVRVSAFDGATDLSFLKSNFERTNSSEPPYLAAVAVASNGTVYTAGPPQKINGVSRRGLAAFSKLGVPNPKFEPPVGADEEFLDVEVTEKQQVLATSDVRLISRFLANGRMDPKFKQPLQLRNVPTIARIAIAPCDGAIVIAGDFEVEDENGIMHFGVVRLHADGSVDTAFSAGLANDFVGYDVAVASDGSIYIAGGNGSPGDYFPEGRKLDVSGSILHRFDVDPFSPSPRAVAVQVDGKVFFGDQRYLPDGSFDTAWQGASGVYTVLAIMPQADGKIVFSQYNPGPYMGGLPPVPELVRLTSEGFIDESFSVECTEEVLDIDLQADGKLLIAGRFSTVNGGSRPCLARLLNDKRAAWKKGAPRFGPILPLCHKEGTCLPFVTGWYYMHVTAFAIVPETGQTRSHVSVGFAYLKAGQDSARVTEVRVPESGVDFQDPIPLRIGTGSTYSPTPGDFATAVEAAGDGDVSKAPCLLWGPGTIFRTIDCQPGVIAFNAQGPVAVISNALIDETLTPRGPAISLISNEVYSSLPESARLPVNNVGQMYSGDASFANPWLNGIPRVLQFVAKSSSKVTFAISYYLVETPEEGATLTLDDVKISDTKPPTLGVKTPANKTKVAGDSVVLSGVAVDRGWIDSVQWRVNTGPWQDAGPGPSWAAVATGLAVGSNAIEVRATDGAGNVSKPVIRTIIRETPIIVP